MIATRTYQLNWTVCERAISQPCLFLCNTALYGPIDIGESITAVLPVDTATCDDHELAAAVQLKSDEVSEQISSYPLSSSTSLDFDFDEGISVF